MHEKEWLAQQFEGHRAHLRTVAYRMLGSRSEADDAVQEAWLRVHRAGPAGVANLGGWLTTIVARVSLDMLRSRKARREEAFGTHAPDNFVRHATPDDEELADSVGLALLVVLETLNPAERVAFVSAPHVRSSLRANSTDCRPLSGRGTTAGKPCAAARAGPPQGSRRRRLTSARNRRGVSRRLRR